MALLFFFVLLRLLKIQRKINESGGRDIIQISVEGWVEGGNGVNFTKTETINKLGLKMTLFKKNKE